MGASLMDRNARANSYYNVAKPQSLPTRVSRYQRQRMFAQFIQEMAPTPENTIADVGATSDRQHDHSNYFEAWYPYKAKVTAVGIEDAAFLEEAYLGVKFVRGSALALPFENGSFDLVHSSAVIEHVGSMENQIQVLSELWRIARLGIFVTTPNRWFPIEVHTVLPFLHYLPARQYRAVLRAAGT